MVAKIRFHREPPIGCDTADRALTGRVDAESLLRVGRQGAIAAELEIEQVVHEGIAGEASDLLRVYLIDKRAGSRRRRQSRADIRKAPSRYSVPDVLNCRVIIGGHTPE